LDLKQEEERVRLEEEAEVEMKRQEARRVALKRGLNVDYPEPPEDIDDTAPLSSPSEQSQMSADYQPSSPLSPSERVEPSRVFETMPFPTFDPQTAPESGALDMEGSDFSGAAHTPNRPLSLREEATDSEATSTFVPARLPQFESRPD